MSQQQQYSIPEILTWAFPAFVAVLVFIIWSGEASLIERLVFAVIIGGSTWIFTYIFYLTCKWIAAVVKKDDPN